MRAQASRCLVLLLVVTFSTAAHADRLLFESYVGNRPAEAARVAPLIRSVFERHGFTVDPLVLAMFFREHAYRPGLVAPHFAEALKRAELRAENDFWEEKYPKVIEDLGNQIIAMRQNPLIFTREPKHREIALRVLVFYALACGRQARVLADKPDEAAKFERLRDDTMAEVVRSYPTKVVTRKDFGEEGEKLFSTVRDQVNKNGRGRISITTNDPDAVIYINEIVEGTAKVEVGDLVPGVYRALILAPTGEARQYEVEATANQTSRLLVDWGVDSLLVLEHWAGFKYPSEKEHARETSLVRLLAQTHTNASTVATVTVTFTRGRLAVTGTSYETRSGKILQSGRVELTGSPSNDTMLNRLADCLVGEICAEGVLPVSHPEYTPPAPEPKVEEPPPAAMAAEPITPTESPTPRNVRSRPGWPKWVAGGSSVLLLAGGGYLANKSLTVCGFGSSPDCSSRAYGVVGYSAWGAGVALGGLSLYWFFDLTPEQLPTWWIIGGGAAALGAGIGLYAIDQDPGPHEAPHYRDTAPLGVTIGVLGMAAIGVGVWSETRNHTPSSSMPTMSFSSSRAVVGWQGKF